MPRARRAHHATTDDTSPAAHYALHRMKSGIHGERILRAFISRCKMPKKRKQRRHEPLRLRVLGLEVLAKKARV